MNPEGHKDTDNQLPIIPAEAVGRSQAEWHAVDDDVAMRSLRQLRIFVEHVPAPIAMLDSQMRIWKSANDGWRSTD